MVALSCRRQSRAQNRDGSEVTAPESSESQSLPVLRSAINGLKVEFLEAHRDKRMYSSHITGLHEKYI